MFITPKISLNIMLILVYIYELFIMVISQRDINPDKSHTISYHTISFHYQMFSTTLQFCISPLGEALASLIHQPAV